MADLITYGGEEEELGASHRRRRLMLAGLVAVAAAAAVVALYKMYGGGTAPAAAPVALPTCPAASLMASLTSQAYQACQTRQAHPRRAGPPR